jgi:tetratricopeptide (TPR) repeat protein
VVTRRSYGFRTYEAMEIALYHTLGRLPEPESTHRFCWGGQFQSWYLNDAEKANVLAEAEQHARSAVTLTTRRPSYKTFYALADVQEDRSELSASQQSFKKALALANTSEERSDVYRALLRTSTAEGSTQEAEQWFQKLSATGLDRALDWENEGSRLYDQHKYKEAGDAYNKAAAKGLLKDSCYAATDYFISGADDASLSAARLCISDNTGKPNTDTNISGAHLLIASILNKRGVYGEALSHAKEATVLDPKNAANFDTVAQALIGLQRPHEAAEASDQAIRLSDGGVAQYHFTLGSAYFDMENWQLARQSYEKAAELNPKDPASAYNVALCLSKQQHFMDAAHWYEEYLRRNPDAKDKADILNRIQILKR